MQILFVRHHCSLHILQVCLPFCFQFGLLYVLLSTSSLAPLSALHVVLSSILSCSVCSFTSRCTFILPLDPSSACFASCSAFSLTACSVLLSALSLDPTSSLSLFQHSALSSVLLSAWPLVLLSTLFLARVLALHVVLPVILSPVLPSASFASTHVQSRHNELCLHQCVRSMF